MSLAASPGEGIPIEIGSSREVFFDAALVETFDGTELRLGHPEEQGTVLRFDAPWEGRYCGYVTVFQDADRYRMYYRGLPQAGKDGSDSEVTCYAESADGLTWTKPDLGVVVRADAPANNIVLADHAPFSHNFAPFLDTNPDAPAEERYKALAGTAKTGLHAFVSPDGIHWTQQDGARITEGAFDSQNVSFWSESEQQYLCYFRTWSKGEFAGYRSVSRATSKDFRTWSKPEPMTFGNTPMEHLYTNQTEPYYRAPHVYVSLAARFMPGRRVLSAAQQAATGVEAQYSGDCSDSVFMSSRGGTAYDRTFMEGFIKPGLDPNDWTSRTNYPARGIVPTGEHAMSFYVQRDYGQPTAHLVRYSLRPDGFVSVWAPYAGGEMLTKPLVFSGNSLHLNFATSAAGDVRVQIESAEGEPLPGYAFEDCTEIIGNNLDHAVEWNGSTDVSSLAGQAIRLHFQMKDAELYAIQFVE
ncbi:MAG: hypothetical protein GC168_07610 [Candidatus Hydrogenedens sp.]|nr:hypothetical protein [Candidatus Hydrogenedens sp.]